MKKSLLFILVTLVSSLAFSSIINGNLVARPSDIVAQNYFLKLSGTYHVDTYLETETTSIDGTIRIDFPLVTLGVHAYTSFSTSTLDNPDISFLNLEGAVALTFGPLYGVVSAPFYFGEDNLYITGIPSVAFGIASQKETYRSYSRIDLSYIPKNLLTIVNGKIDLNPDFDPLDAALRINLYSEKRQKFGVDVIFEDLKLFLEQQELLYSISVIFGKTLSFYGAYSNVGTPYKVGGGLDFGALQFWAFAALNDQFDPEEFELSVSLNF